MGTYTCGHADTGVRSHTEVWVGMLYTKEITSLLEVRPHTGVWVGITFPLEKREMRFVRPYTGTWVGISGTFSGAGCGGFAHVWGRGLEWGPSSQNVKLASFTPHTGAWVGIRNLSISSLRYLVHPRRGVWVGIKHTLVPSC